MFKVYENAKLDLYNKDMYIQNYLNYMFSKTNEIFIYKNLPAEIDVKRMEYFLQKNGFVYFTKKEGSFKFYNGSLYDFDIYDIPQKINIVLENRSVESVNLNDSDGVLINNDFLRLGLLPIFNKYGVMLNECEITLYMSTIMHRLQYLISANDDNTKKSADKFLENIYNGEFSNISGNALFESLEVKSTSDTNNKITDNIELTQYIKASAFNEIGLNANFNMKRARLNVEEVSLNEYAIKPLIENMFDSRKNAIEKINKLYGLNIELVMSELWDTSNIIKDVKNEHNENIESEVKENGQKETEQSDSENKSDSEVKATDK